MGYIVSSNIFYNAFDLAVAALLRYPCPKSQHISNAQFARPVRVLAHVPNDPIDLSNINPIQSYSNTNTKMEHSYLQSTSPLFCSPAWNWPSVKGHRWHDIPSSCVRPNLGALFGAAGERLPPLRQLCRLRHGCGAIVICIVGTRGVFVAGTWIASCADGAHVRNAPQLFGMLFVHCPKLCEWVSPPNKLPSKPRFKH